MIVAPVVGYLEASLGVASVWIAKRFEAATLAVVAGVAILISILDLAGTLDGISWLKDRIPILTLLIIGVMAAYVVAERTSAVRDEKEALQSVIHETIAGLSGIEVRSFDSSGDFWLYAASCIKASKATIDDLTWGLHSTSSTSAQDVASYWEYRRQIAIATTGKGDSRTKVYREIMSFPDADRIARTAPLMNEKHPNYHLRFYDYDHTGTPFLLQFYVFDRVEVLISSHSESGSPRDNRYMAFRNAQLAETLSHYFETVWRGAIRLKDSSHMRPDLLEAIAERFDEPPVTGTSGRAPTDASPAGP